MRPLNNILKQVIHVKSYTRVLAWLLIAIATALPFLLVPFESFRFRDEPYQALCCLEYERAYAAILTFFVGNEWMAIFGKSFIGLRCLMTLCFELSAAIGCVYLYRRGVTILRISVIYLITTIGLVLSYLPIYNWDSGAYPITALGLFCLLSYIDAPSRNKIILLGCLAGLMTLFRLPLVAVLAITAIFIIINSRGRLEACANIGIHFAMAVIVFALGTTLLVGSPAAYLTTLSPENTAAGHTIANIPEIINVSIGHVYSQYQYMLPGMVAILLSICFAKIDRPKAYLWIGALLLLYFTIRSIVMNHNEWSFWWSHNGILIPAAILCVYFTPLIDNLNGEKIPRKTALGCLALTAFILLQALGSDSVSERIGWGLGFIFAFGVNHEAFLKYSRFTDYLLVFTAIAILGYFSMVYLRLNNAWGPTIKTECTTAIDGTRNYSTFNPYQEIDSVKIILDNARKVGVETDVIGMECATYTFILENRSSNSAMRFNLNDSEVVNDVKSIVLKDNSGNVVAWMDEEKDDKVAQLLHERGFNRWLQIGDHFTIYATDEAKRHFTILPVESD